MDLTIHQTFFPHDDPDAALAFSGDTLGAERLTSPGRSHPDSGEL
jgi:hypothetical protein